MFSFNMFDHPIPRVFQSRFSTQYRCFSVSMLAGPNDRSDVERGGKIIMPPSALDQLSRLNITYPMLFKLTNKNSDRVTHCGVLEFVADEGICYLPHWMMQNLLLEEGGLVQVESVNLQVATYSKFQPQSPDFLDITNPKAVLENALRNFACLTTGDVIAINYNEKIYELRVMETKPDKAVSIIECDMNVDFDAPLGYKEPERQAQHEESAEGEADHSGYTGELGFRAFSGSGNRLDGKKKGVEPSPSPVRPGDIKRGIPNYEFKLGKITFIRNSRPLVKKVEEDEAGGRFVAFSGEGQSLRVSARWQTQTPSLVGSLACEPPRQDAFHSLTPDAASGRPPAGPAGSPGRTASAPLRPASCLHALGRGHGRDSRSRRLDRAALEPGGADLFQRPELRGDEEKAAGRDCPAHAGLGPAPLECRAPPPGCYWLPARMSRSLAHLKEVGEELLAKPRRSLVPLPVSHAAAAASGGGPGGSGTWRKPPRPCEAYRAEWELCRSAGHFLRHYYVHGERPACGQWRRDLASCREWEQRRSAEAQRSLCESERARVRAARKHGLVWAPRQSPPEDWHLPLPEDKDG
ncbi:hypothetical protein R6Z07F_015408 [Ovis aries]